VIDDDRFHIRLSDAFEVLEHACWREPWRKAYQGGDVVALRKVVDASDIRRDLCLLGFTLLARIGL
jgi:hypothetical protein